MELLKTVASPFRKIISYFTVDIPNEKKTEAKPKQELTTLGRQLYWEARRKKSLLREQQNKPAK